MISALFGLLFGVALGARHAFEPDHLAAIATLVAESRGARHGALLGALWGLGHTLSLVTIGLTLIAIGRALPAGIAAGGELAVSVMLVILGARAVHRALRGGSGGELAAHAHALAAHAHRGPAAHVHLRQRTLALRPLLVGLVHGVAGSGALTAIAIARSPSPAARLAYIAMFGVGSIGGMAAVSAIAAASLGRRSPPRALGVAFGALSIAVGAVWTAPLW